MSGTGYIRNWQGSLYLAVLIDFSLPARDGLVDETHFGQGDRPRRAGHGGVAAPANANGADLFRPGLAVRKRPVASVLPRPRPRVQQETGAAIAEELVDQNNLKQRIG